MTPADHKTAVITGAAGGLGKALAIVFARKGYHLALADVHQEGLEALQKALLPTGIEVSIHCADVADEQQVATLHKEVTEKHKAIGILVNNAAISISMGFEDLDLKAYHRLMDVNFWGTVYCSKYFLPELKKQDNSRLVNIISDFALMGFPGKTTYGSSKSAVMGFSHSLKTELADSHVKVCLVIPPPLDTGIVKNNIHISEVKKQQEAAFLEKNGMPLDKAAKRIVRQIEKGRFRIVIGAMMFAIDLFSRLFPTYLHLLIGKYKKYIDFV